MLKIQLTASAYDLGLKPLFYATPCKNRIIVENIYLCGTSHREENLPNWLDLEKTKPDW